MLSCSEAESRKSASEPQSYDTCHAENVDPSISLQSRRVSLPVVVPKTPIATDSLSEVNESTYIVSIKKESLPSKEKHPTQAAVELSPCFRACKILNRNVEEDIFHTPICLYAMIERETAIRVSKLSSDHVQLIGESIMSKMEESDYKETDTQDVISKGHVWKQKTRNRRPKNKAKYFAWVKEKCAEYSRTKEGTVIIRNAQLSSRRIHFFKDMIKVIHDDIEAYNKSIMPKLSHKEDCVVEAATRKVVSDENDYTCENNNLDFHSDIYIEDLTRSGFCHISLAWGATNGYDEYLANNHNKIIHATNGNILTGEKITLKDIVDTMGNSISVMQTQGNPFGYLGTEGTLENARKRNVTKHFVVHGKVFPARENHPSWGFQVHLKEHKDKLDFKSSSNEGSSDDSRILRARLTMNSLDLEDSGLEEVDLSKCTYYKFGYSQELDIIKSQDFISTMKLLGYKKAIAAGGPLEFDVSNGPLALIDLSMVISKLPDYLIIPNTYRETIAFKTRLGTTQGMELKINLYAMQSSYELINRTGYPWLQPWSEVSRCIRVNDRLTVTSKIGGCTARQLDECIPYKKIPVIDSEGIAFWNFEDPDLRVVVVDNDDSEDKVYNDSIRLLSRIPYPAYQIVRKEEYKDYSEMNNNYPFRVLGIVDAAGLVEIEPISPLGFLKIIVVYMSENIIPSFVGEMFPYSHLRTEPIMVRNAERLIKRACRLVGQGRKDPRVCYDNIMKVRRIEGTTTDWNKIAVITSHACGRYMPQAEVHKDGKNLYVRYTPGNNDAILTSLSRDNNMTSLFDRNIEWENLPCNSAVTDLDQLFVHKDKLRGSEYHQAIGRWNNYAELMVGYGIYNLVGELNGRSFYPHVYDSQLKSQEIRLAFEMWKTTKGLQDRLVTSKENSHFSELTHNNSNTSMIVELVEIIMANTRMYWTLNRNVEKKDLWATITGYRLGYKSWYHDGGINIYRDVVTALGYGFSSIANEFVPYSLMRTSLCTSMINFKIDLNRYIDKVRMVKGSSHYKINNRVIGCRLHSFYDTECIREYFRIEGTNVVDVVLWGVNSIQHEGETNIGLITFPACLYNSPIGLGAIVSWGQLQQRVS